MENIRTFAGMPTVEMRDICKSFLGVLANDHINFEIQPGEVHALLGENGAGKTTLMNILSGHYQLDRGEIRVNGQAMSFGSPRDAIEAGIGMVHQHFRLVDVFTVAQNITLGLHYPRFRLKSRHIEEEVSKLAETYGLSIDPSSYIWQLSVGERQKVEIIKTLHHGAQVLILDEPTAVLTPQEAEELQKVLRDLASTGRSVIFISHKLKEVVSVADRITVLRGGKNVAVVEKSEADADMLARLMVGSEVTSVVEKRGKEPGEVAIAIQDLEVLGDKGSMAVCSFTLKIREGEIVGLAGVSGNGQSELAECIYGLRPAYSGHIYVSGREVTNLSPLQILGSGLRLIPEDRLGIGLVPMLSVQENLILISYRDPRFGRGPFLDFGRVRDYSKQLIEQFSIQITHQKAPAWKLSGGNLQRLLLAREISSQPRALVAVLPTRGLDIQATAEIQHMLLRLRDTGAAILLVSEDLDEIFALSDRIAVIFEGRLLGEVPRNEASIEEIGLMMAGSRMEHRPG